MVHSSEVSDSKTQLEQFIVECLGEFFRRKLEILRTFDLKKSLRNQNPYYFKVYGINRAEEIVEQLMTDYIDSSDETMFGEAFFEPIARIASGAKVSDAEGVDFVIESEDRVLTVALKSGPNIYNASQKKRQSQEFSALRNRLYKLHKQFDPMLGHAYGRAKAEPTKDLVYRRRSGQAFWTEITGDPDFYLKLVRLMKEEPAKHRQKYAPSWDAAVNRFTAEFVKDFCFPDGRIDWEKLVRFVSEDATRS